MNNRDSLRKQIIDAMKSYCDKYKFYTLNEKMMFDEAIMPVLEAAMRAGELLLHRATTPPKPVNDALIEWLEGCCEVIKKVQSEEATVCRKEALRILYQLRQNAINALGEAKGSHNPNGYTENPSA